MIITIKRNEQLPKIEIDLQGVYYTYAIRNALITALELDGFDKEKIRQIFGLDPDQDQLVQEESKTEEK